MSTRSTAATIGTGTRMHAIPALAEARTLVFRVQARQNERMASIRSIVWGVRDIRRGVEFWTAALDYVPKDEPGDDWASLVPREGDGVQLSLMLVGSDKPHRHHLDLDADDRDAEVERLVALGAGRVDDWEYEDGADYVVLTDPDGNPFCVV